MISQTFRKSPKIGLDSSDPLLRKPLASATHDKTANRLEPVLGIPFVLPDAIEGQIAVQVVGEVLGCLGHKQTAAVGGVVALLRGHNVDLRALRRAAVGHGEFLQEILPFLISDLAVDRDSVLA